MEREATGLESARIRRVAVAKPCKAAGSRAEAPQESSRLCCGGRWRTFRTVFLFYLRSCIWWIQPIPREHGHRDDHLPQQGLGFQCTSGSQPSPGDGVESAIISDVKMRGTHSQSKFRECLKGVPAFKTVIEIKESGCRVPCPLRSEGPMACLCLASSWEIHPWQRVQ